MWTSYAQNFEDVILARVLKNIKLGFYVDIGTQDPVMGSVSRAFYEKGWRGAHVEPTPYYVDKIRADRPDEDIIQVAVSSQTGPIAFFEIPETGLSTGKKFLARRHALHHGFKAVPITVPCLRLSDILDRYSAWDIHWLKIDVEGMEADVLASWHPSPIRPWIIVIESTAPLSCQPSYAEWEQGLLGLGYSFVYFDGLNRFYVSVEYSELTSAFCSGPTFSTSLNCPEPQLRPSLTSSIEK